MLVIAERDAEIRDTVRGLMSARGYRVEAAADAEAAAHLLAREPVDVLVAELALHGSDGTDLLSLARASSPFTRRIAIADDASPHHRDAGLRLGAVRVLVKPLSLLELAEAIGVARDCADGFHGWMHRMSLIDVLQMYHQAGQSLAIAVHGDVDGVIALRNGELVHAECAGRVGMPALIQLLAERRGHLKTTPLETVIRTLTGTFDQVLLDAVRSLDETQRPANPEGGEVIRAGWLDDFEDHGGLDRQALGRWLAEHAPGAAAWRIELDGAGDARPILERLDPPEPDALGLGLADPPGALGWAYELAELGDPGWTRVELLTGGAAVALIRVSGIIIAFARMVSDSASLGRFQLESARLARWLTEQLGGAR